MKVKYFSFSLLLVLVIVYVILRDKLPPRTPRKIARSISGLRINSDYAVSSFTEEWNQFNGDGSLVIEINLNDEQLSRLLVEGIQEGYHKLPIMNPPPELSGALFLKDMKGYYRIAIHDKYASVFDLAIIDTRNKKLRIFVFAS
jgi:hypothetical protein